MPCPTPNLQPTAEARSPAAAGARPSCVDALMLGKALGFGVLVVLAVGAGSWVTGLLPAATLSYVAIGTGAALAAAMLAVWLHGRFLDGRTATRLQGDGRLLAGHLQSLLAAAFAVKLLFLIAGVVVLRQQDVKFAELATFCITFAAVSLLCQVATAGYLARAIQPVLRPVGATSPVLGAASPTGGHDRSGMHERSGPDDRTRKAR